MSSCWIEVDCQIVTRNFRALQELVGPDVDVIAVLKADAYGLGAIQIARALQPESPRYLAVTRVEEAVALRQGGSAAPILVMAPAPPCDVEALVESGATACISDVDDARRLSDAASRQGVEATCQLKINTGMGRLGVEPEIAIEAATRIMSLPNLKLEAAWTHFADASEARPVMIEKQFARFQPLVHQMVRQFGIAPRAFHCCNSSALLRFAALRLSCVRSGTLLYGQFPSGAAAEAGERAGLQLHDPFTAHARVIAIKTLQAGQRVGYGGEWVAKSATRIATLGIGFADGLTQQPHTRDEAPGQIFGRAMRESARQIARRGDGARRVRWNGRSAPIIGRIAMQSCSIDATNFPELKVGDAVIVPMRRTSAQAHLSRVYR